jgi:hypothetical protein
MSHLVSTPSTDSGSSGTKDGQGASDHDRPYAFLSTPPGARTVSLQLARVRAAADPAWPSCGRFLGCGRHRSESAAATVAAAYHSLADSVVSMCGLRRPRSARAATRRCCALRYL